VSHRGELLQHLVVGGGARLSLLQNWKLVLLEQHVPELGRRVDVEVGTRGVIDRALERGQLAAKVREDLPQSRQVDAYPRDSMSTSTGMRGISIVSSRRTSW